MQVSNLKQDVLAYIRKAGGTVTNRRAKGSVIRIIAGRLHVPAEQVERVLDGLKASGEVRVDGQFQEVRVVTAKKSRTRATAPAPVPTSPATPAPDPIVSGDVVVGTSERIVLGRTALPGYLNLALLALRTQATPCIGRCAVHGRPECKECKWKCVGHEDRPAHGYMTSKPSVLIYDEIPGLTTSQAEELTACLGRVGMRWSLRYGWSNTVYFVDLETTEVTAEMLAASETTEDLAEENPVTRLLDIIESLEAEVASLKSEVDSLKSAVDDRDKQLAEKDEAGQRLHQRIEELLAELERLMGLKAAGERLNAVLQRYPAR